MKLKSKKAIITGASSGIGLSVAERLSKEGAEIICVARSKNKLSDFCGKINGSGGKAGYFQCDLSKEEEREDLFKNVNGVINDKIDIIVNAAGMQSMTPVMYNNEALWIKLMRVNVIAPAEMIRGFKSKLKEGSVIINIASVAGTKASAGMSAYAASKAALISFTQTAAVELASKKIRVNAIVPGMIKTPMLDEMLRFYTQEKKERLERKHLLGFGRSEDVANAVVFLASDNARWITGTSLVVDGGFALK